MKIFKVFKISSLKNCFRRYGYSIRQGVLSSCFPKDYRRQSRTLNRQVCREGTAVLRNVLHNRAHIYIPHDNRDPP